MSVFAVVLEATYQRTAYVEADSRDEACEKALNYSRVDPGNFEDEAGVTGFWHVNEYLTGLAE